MPFSWVKVSSGSSRKIRQCAGDDRSKRKFESCVRALVEKRGGRVESLYFEQNGKFAHVHLCYDDDKQRSNIIFDLEGEDVIDLVTAEEIDERHAADSAAD